MVFYNFLHFSSHIFEKIEILLYFMKLENDESTLNQHKLHESCATLRVIHCNYYMGSDDENKSKIVYNLIFSISGVCL